LFALTGPSGAGKSTVGPLLWIDGLRDDVDGHPAFRSV
jgi:ABC-type sulfate/molybdate transport systems ATPase subunit